MGYISFTVASHPLFFSLPLFYISLLLISSLILNTSASSYPFPSIVPRSLSSIFYPAFPLTYWYSTFSLFFRFFLCFSWILSCSSSYFSFSSTSFSFTSSFSSSSSYSPFTFCTFFFLSTLFLPPVLKILFTSLFFSPLSTHSCILLFHLLQFFIICSTSFIYYFSLSPILPFLFSPHNHAPQSPNVFLSFFIYFPSLISKYISQFQLSETECD